MTRLTQSILMAAIVVMAMLAAPTAASAGVLPELGPGEHYSTFLYGGQAGQEAWYQFSQLFNEKTAGDLLSLPSQIPGLEPHGIEAWYRVRGDVAGELPEEAQDFSIRTVYAIDTTPGPWVPYFAFEQVQWTSGPEIDSGYYGIGTEWHPSDGLELDGSIWHDGGENYRVAGTAQMSVRGASTIEAMVWLLMDGNDAWGLWRVTASHPLNEDMDLVGMYEHSTRSEVVVATGIGFSF